MIAIWGGRVFKCKIEFFAKENRKENKEISWVDWQVYEKENKEDQEKPIKTYDLKTNIELNKIFILYKC